MSSKQNQVTKVLSKQQEITTKMSSKQLEAKKVEDNIEVYYGDEICTQKSIELLNEIFLPEGLLPLEDIIEVGYNRTTGFVWLKQKKKKEHSFRLINRLVSFGTEVTAYAEERRLKRVTGVKAKEIIWLPIHDIYIEDGCRGKITFANVTGISRSFPASAFELEEKKCEQK